MTQESYFKSRLVLVWTLVGHMRIFTKKTNTLRFGLVSIRFEPTEADTHIGSVSIVEGVTEVNSKDAVHGKTG